MSQVFADVASAAGSWATLGLFLFALLGAALGAHRWAMKHVAEPLREVPILVRKVGAMEEVLADVQSELKPNHGSSMRDSTDRSEQIAVQIAERVGVVPTEASK